MSRNLHKFCLQRVAAGRYVFEQFSIDLTPDGWRWMDTKDPSTGGEWRNTLAEATLDLKEFLLTPKQD